jgi:hypothetical protein
MANGTKHRKSFFVEEEGSPTDVMLAGQDTQMDNIRFGFPVSPFVMSKSDLYSEKVSPSRGGVLNDPKTDILVAESLVLPCGSIIIIILVIVVGIVWVGPRLWILICRVIVFDPIRAVISTIPVVILICLFTTGSLPLCRINQLGWPTASVDQEEHDCCKCYALVFGRKYGCVAGPVVGEEEDEVVGSQHWLGRLFSSQIEVIG